MVKKTLYGLALLLLLGAAGVYLAFNYIDVLVKVALEHYGPRVTGTGVHVGEVRISPGDGRGVIRALEVGSPPGFTAPRTARFGEIRVALDPATITSRVIVVRELAVDAAQVTYEKGAKGANLDAIQERIQGYAKASAAAATEGANTAWPKRRFIIERLVIRGTRVTMTHSGLGGQGLDFDLPDIELLDIGKRQGGLTASEVAALVAGTLQNRIAQKVLTNIDLLRKGGVAGVVDALKGLLK